MLSKWNRMASIDNIQTILPFEVNAKIYSFVLDEAILNRDYATVSTVFKVSTYFNSIASDFFRQVWLNTELIEETTDLRLKLPCVTDDKIDDGRLVTKPKLVTNQGEREINHYAACHRVRLVSLLFIACFKKIKINSLFPLRALVEATRDILFTKSLLANQELFSPMAKFLRQHSILWLKDKNDAESYRSAFNEVLCEDGSVGKKVFDFKSKNPAFLLPFQSFVNDDANASPMNWVENSHLALLLLCPTTEQREALFCDRHVLNPTFERPTVGHEQYNEHQIAYAIIQQMFQTRRSDALFDDLQQQLNVNVCLLQVFIRHCIHFENPSDRLFQDLLHFARKQSPEVKDVFCSHLKEIVLEGTVKYPLTMEMNERNLFHANANQQILKEFQVKYASVNYVLEHNLEDSVKTHIYEAILTLSSDRGIDFFCDNITKFDHQFCKKYLEECTSLKSLSAAKLQGLLVNAAAHFLSFDSEDSIGYCLSCLEKIVKLIDAVAPDVIKSLYISWWVIFLKKDVEMLSPLHKHLVLAQIKALLPILNYAHLGKTLDLIRAVGAGLPDFYQYCLNGNRRLNSFEYFVLLALMTDDDIPYFHAIFYDNFYTEKQLMIFETWCKKLSTMPNQDVFFLRLLNNTKTSITKSTLENLAAWGINFPNNSLIYLAPRARTEDIIKYLITKFKCDPKIALDFWARQGDTNGVQVLQQQIRQQNKRKLAHSKHESVKKTVKLFEIEQER